jgi:hypothetical protein
VWECVGDLFDYSRSQRWHTSILRGCWSSFLLSYILNSCMVDLATRLTIPGMTSHLFVSSIEIRGWGPQCMGRIKPQQRHSSMNLNYRQFGILADGTDKFMTRLICSSVVLCMVQSRIVCTRICDSQPMLDRQNCSGIGRFHAFGHGLYPSLAPHQ